jgi:hypothetical protein
MLSLFTAARPQPTHPKNSGMKPQPAAWALAVVAPFNDLALRASTAHQRDNLQSKAEIF